MEQVLDLKVNELPARTWNRLGMNDTQVKNMPAALQALQVTDLATGQVPAACPGRDAAFDAVPSALGETFCAMGRQAAAAPLLVRGSAEGAACALRFAGDGFREVDLLTGENERLTVWMLADSRQTADVCALRTCIRAGRGSRVRLVQVHLPGQPVRFFNDVGAVCEEGAAVELVQLFPGGAATYAGCRTELEGNGSSLDVDIACLGRGRERIDLNYVANHHGRRTRSRMQADSVLEDAASKIFRGTIDFKQGSAGAEGAETESVLLLGEDVTNQTIPLILCAEEDVQGSHGASIGQPDEAVLFYLGTRGIGTEAACSLLARSRLDAVCRQIGNEQVEEAVQAYLLEVMGDGE